MYQRTSARGRRLRNPTTLGTIPSGERSLSEHPPGRISLINKHFSSQREGVSRPPRDRTRARGRLASGETGLLQRRSATRLQPKNWVIGVHEYEARDTKDGNLQPPVRTLSPEYVKITCDMYLAITLGAALSAGILGLGMALCRTAGRSDSKRPKDVSVWQGAMERPWGGCKRGCSQDCPHTLRNPLSVDVRIEN